MRLPIASPSLAPPLALAAALAPLAVVATLAAACHCGGRAAPPTIATAPAVAAVPYASLCAPMQPLVLPGSITTALALTEVNGKLAVDGTVTAAAWPMRAPIAYTLPDGRVFLDDTYNANELWLWEPATRTLTSLGRGGLAGVANRGFLVHTEPSPGVVIYSDIDAHAPRLRELYRAGSYGATFAGSLDGAIAILERTSADGGAALACVSGPSAITRIPIDLPPGLHIANDDAIRDHRVLLVGDVDPRRESGGLVPFDVPVEILSLDTHERRRIGLARGGYSNWTDMPHPYVFVEWSDVARPRFEQNPPNVVDVATETLGAARPR